MHFRPRLLCMEIVYVFRLGGIACGHGKAHHWVGCKRAAALF